MYLNMVVRVTTDLLKLLDRTFECVPISVYAEILQGEAQSAYDYPTGDRALVVAGTSGKPSKKSWVKVATLSAVKS